MHTSVVTVFSVAMYLVSVFGETTTSGPANMSRDPRMLMWRQTFFWAAILLFIFFVASWAILRFSIRFRSAVLREKPAPTPSDDVWAMHRVPDENGERK